jgi:cytochrome c biogenesis protein CcdA
MWVLLFLISVLIGMKDRRRMWAIGLTFLLTSAFVYLLIMLSWISIAVKITTIVWVRNVIAVIAVIGGVINLKSFFKSNDSGCEVVDDKKRKNIFKKIRKFTSEKSFFLALIGVMGLAISVNLVELACSAGLPLVFSELLALNNTSSFMKFMYTLVYIFFFLIDDLVVFLIAMFTMKVTGISTKYNKFSHLIGGIIMLVVGILLIFKPGLLMFNFS